MQQYKDLINRVFRENNLTENRTDTNTYNSFGGQLEIDLSKGFPLLTTKEVNFHAIVIELIWFIRGDTNIQYLVQNNTNIWNEWAYQRYMQSVVGHDSQLTQEQFIQCIKEDDNFAKKHGDLGAIYGKQWRNFAGVDQLMNAIDTIKHQPHSRRIIVNSWNPVDIPKMALPPCHCLFQFQVSRNKLNLHLYQRSADVFLGVPFNIASYSLLLHMVAQITGYQVGKFFHSFGDLHIYENHIEQCQEILRRKTYTLPTLELNPKIKRLEDFGIGDIKLINYKSHPKIVGKVAV